MRNQLMGDLGTLLQSYTQAKMQGDMASRQRHLQAIRELGLQARSVAETGVAMERLKQEQQLTALQREKQPYEIAQMKTTTGLSELELEERSAKFAEWQKTREATARDLAAVGYTGTPESFMELVRTGQGRDILAKLEARAKFEVPEKEAIAEGRKAEAEIAESVMQSRMSKALLSAGYPEKRAETMSKWVGLEELMKWSQYRSIMNAADLAAARAGQIEDEAKRQERKEQIAANLGQDLAKLEVMDMIHKLEQDPSPEFYETQIGALSRAISSIYVRATIPVEEFDIPGLSPETRGWMQAMSQRATVSPEDKQEAIDQLTKRRNHLIQVAEIDYPDRQWTWTVTLGGEKEVGLSEEDRQRLIEQARQQRTR